ncbi:hypothetical protein [Thermocrinis minervae]|uniref:Uncharacterized protein n=1 Tax=Thermocrinis minervae TaxID=381751 RepID=A0A1M6QAA6_9AQUI|nr:hypothetical protein [Thermocrinis minervae]SHK17027.1 hypothetical protein SAMN05444391_0144 [Thermocrinis minervae]
MKQAIRLFHAIVTKYTDLVWMKSRDDLISKCMKALRAYSEDKEPEDKKGIEDSLEILRDFVQNNREAVPVVLSLLSLYVKSPTPCKSRLISFSEVLLEDNRASQTGRV